MPRLEVRTEKHPSFDLDHDSTGLTQPVPRRPLTVQEREWANAILQTNKAWADVTLGDIVSDR